MNNEQFRRLLHTKPPPSPKNDLTSDSHDPTSRAAAALRSRQRSSIPMTPRAVNGAAGIDFARQVASNRATKKPAKQFKSIAPRGSNLAKGYHDRTQERTTNDDEYDDNDDDAGKRIKALEESLKLGQIEQATFERLRDEITGGDINKTHLVKGLDWKLLQRIKQGEQVQTSAPEADTKRVTGDVDDEFEALEKKEVVAVLKEDKQKKGQMASPAVLAGSKRTRDQILAELKASRKRAAEASNADQPQLGAKFRKIGEPRESSRLEIDAKGREVLIVTDANGIVKRKVKKSRPDESQSNLPVPDRNATVLGADVVIPQLKEQKDESDDDIYAGLEDDYNPLGDDDEDTSDSDSESNAAVNEVVARDKQSSAKIPVVSTSDTDTDTDPVHTEMAADASNPLPRNYFNDDPATLSVLSNVVNPMKDPSFLAALAQKAKDSTENSDTKLLTEEEQRLKRRAEMLGAKDRDLEDLDMGFGSSRFDDAEEMAMEGTKYKLSEWKGGHGEDDSDGGNQERGGKKRKRGPKKRKGDKDSAADVLRAMERQKG